MADRNTGGGESVSRLVRGLRLVRGVQGTESEIFIGRVPLSGAPSTDAARICLPNLHARPHESTCASLHYCNTIERYNE